MKLPALIPGRQKALHSVTVEERLELSLMASVCYPSSLGAGEGATCFWGKNVQRGMPTGQGPAAFE